MELEAPQSHLEVRSSTLRALRKPACANFADPRSLIASVEHIVTCPPPSSRISDNASVACVGTHLQVIPYTAPEPLPSPAGVHLEQAVDLFCPLGLPSLSSVGQDCVAQPVPNTGKDVEDTLSAAVMRHAQRLVHPRQGWRGEEVVVDRDALVSVVSTSGCSCSSMALPRSPPLIGPKATASST